MAHAASSGNDPRTEGLPTTRTFWRVPTPVGSALLGGLLSGLVGALLFATAHALIIVPIWSRMWSGLGWGALAGLSAAWVMIETYPTVVTSTPSAAAALGARLGAVLWLLVAPLSVLYAIGRKLGVAPRYELVEVAFAILFALAAGAVFAWYRTRRWRAAIAGALATLLLTVAMAGPVPIERSVRALGIFLAVLPAATIAGAVLALLVRRFHRNTTKSSATVTSVPSPSG